MGLSPNTWAKKFLSPPPPLIFGDGIFCVGLNVLFPCLDFILLDVFVLVSELAYTLKIFKSYRAAMRSSLKPRNAPTFWLHLFLSLTGDQLYFLGFGFSCISVFYFLFYKHKQTPLAYSFPQNEPLLTGL